ncbi:MAG: hypothetical protein WCD69_27855 [Xanthobacteraceae bacterium]
MAARKRAPGGGRKPKGAVAARTVAVRMPDDLRADLASAVRRRRPGWTFSAEVIGRLRRSFIREEQDRHDPGMRALIEMITRVADEVHLEGDSGWHLDPWTFRAFKTGVAKLLDMLEPGGALREPVKAEGRTAESIVRSVDECATAESVGAGAAGGVIRDLMHRMKSLPPERAPMFYVEVEDEMLRDDRLMSRTRSALGIEEPKSSKTGK